MLEAGTEAEEMTTKEEEATIDKEVARGGEDAAMAIEDAPIKGEDATFGAGPTADGTFVPVLPLGAMAEPLPAPPAPPVAAEGFVPEVLGQPSAGGTSAGLLAPPT